jgi:hypothetical protein
MLWQELSESEASLEHPTSSASPTSTASERACSSRPIRDSGSSQDDPSLWRARTGRRHRCRRRPGLHRKPGECMRSARGRAGVPLGPTRSDRAHLLLRSGAEPFYPNGLIQLEPSRKLWLSQEAALGPSAPIVAAATAPLRRGRSEQVESRDFDHHLDLNWHV